MSASVGSSRPTTISTSNSTNLGRRNSSSSSSKPSSLNTTANINNNNNSNTSSPIKSNSFQLKRVSGSQSPGPTSPLPYLNLQQQPYSSTSYPKNTHHAPPHQLPSPPLHQQQPVYPTISTSTKSSHHTTSSSSSSGLASPLPSPTLATTTSNIPFFSQFQQQYSSSSSSPSQTPQSLASNQPKPAGPFSWLFRRTKKRSDDSTLTDGRGSPSPVPNHQSRPISPSTSPVPPSSTTVTTSSSPSPSPKPRSKSPSRRVRHDDFSDEDDDLLFDPDSELARNTLENSKSGTAILSSLRLYIAERSLDDDSDDEDEEEDLDRQYLLSQAAFSGVTPNTIRAVDDVPEDYDADEDDPEVLCDDSDDVPDVPERLVPQPTQAPTPSPSPDNVLTATAEISSLLSTSSGSSDPAVAAESHPETLPRKSSASSINSYLYHLHKTVEHRDSSSSLLKMRKEVDVDRMDGIRRPSPMGRVGSHASLVALSVGNSGTVVVLPSDVVANAVSTDPTTHTPHPKIRKISSVISKASTASSFSESSTSSAGDAGTAIITPTPNLVSPLARRPPAVIEALVEDEEREFGSVVRVVPVSSPPPPPSSPPTLTTSPTPTLRRKKSLDVSTTTELRRRANVTMPTSQAEILARQLRMTTSKDELVGAHGGEVAGRMRVLRRVTTNPNVSAAVAVAAGVVEGGGAGGVSLGVWGRGDRRAGG